MKLRFSLKTLFVLITLVALWLGWRRHVEIESAAVLRAYHAYQRALETGALEEAYSMMTEEYRSRHSLEKFTRNYGHHAGPGNVPHDPNASVSSLSRGRAWVYESEAPGFLELMSGKCYEFRKERGQWRFTGEVEQYYD
jgi:hypothetical protein